MLMNVRWMIKDDVEAASAPQVEQKDSPEQETDSLAETEDGQQKKKKRVGFRDRKVRLTLRNPSVKKI